MKQNKIYKHSKYNLLMKKLSQSYFKQVQTKPIRLQSPDRKSSNSIRPTLSPQNIEYILKQNDRHTTTPTKSSHETPIKNEPRTISNSRYFMGNKSSNIKKSYIKTEQDEHYLPHHLPTSITNSNNRSYTHQDRCQNCVGHCRCVHAVANEEVVVELRRIITMINGAQSVSGFYAGDDDVAKTVEVLKAENQRLSDLLDKYKSRIQSRIDPIPNNYQSQVRILRQQLSHNISQHQKQRQQLYRTNKALSSQLKSMQSKLTSTQTQLQSLRSQVRGSSSTILQPNKKSADKLSLSMIKDQYNSSLKTLQTNIQFDIDNKMNDYQSDLKEYKLRIDILEDRLKGLEKLDYLNQRLNQENKRMKKWIQERDRESLQEKGDRDEEMDKLIKDNYELEDEVKMLRIMVAEKSAYEKVIGQLREGKGVLQRKLEQTDKKVKELMQNYQKQIKILKSKPVQKQSDQTQNLRIQNQQYWQQILKQRNELARYTSQNSKLQSELTASKQQINKLNHKYNNEHINLVARTTLLDNQNQRLRKQLDNSHTNAVPDLQHALAQLQQDHDRLVKDNQKLRQDVGRIGNQNQGLSQEIRVLREENGRINQENQRMNREMRMASSKFNDVQSGRENQRQELLRQLDRARNQIQNLNIEIDKLKNDHKKKQMQLRQSLKQQLDQTKSLYQQQLSQCHSQYTSLSNTHTSILQQLQSLQESQSLHKKSSQQTLAQKDQKIYEHELTISNLSKILEETEQKIIKLQQYRQDRDRQINRLTHQLDKLKDKYQNNIKDNDLYWGKEVDGLKAEIGRLRVELDERDRKEREEVQRVSLVTSRVAKLKSQGLRRELEELKRLVQESSFDKIQQQLTRISENYERELAKSQQKSQQIDSLLRQKFQLEQKVSNLQNIRIGLEQRISTLQSSNKLLQQLQQQQKQSLNRLLSQKQALQKQNISLKRVKLDKQSIEATKSKAKQISMKIDKLLALEEQRQNDYMEISNTYTDVIRESVIIRKI